MQAHSAGLGLSLTMGFVWAVAGVALKELGAQASALQTGAVFLITSGIGALAVFTGTERRNAFDWRTLTSRTGALLCARALVGSLGEALRLYALQFLPIGDAAAICFISPGLVALIELAIAKKSPTASLMASVAMTIAGSVLIARPAFIFPTIAPSGNNMASVSGRTVGILCATGTACLNAIGFVLLRHLRREPSALVISYYGLLGGSILAAGAFLLQGGVFVPLASGAKQWTALGVYAFGGSLASCCCTCASSRVPASVNSLVSSSETAFSYIWQVSWFGEVPHATSVIGAALIVGSVALVALKDSAVQFCTLAQSKDRPRLGTIEINLESGHLAAEKPAIAVISD